MLTHLTGFRQNVFNRLVDNIDVVEFSLDLKAAGRAIDEGVRMRSAMSAGFSLRNECYTCRG